MSPHQVIPATSEHSSERLIPAIRKVPDLFPKLRCLLISCNGKLLMEHYFNGCNASTLHDLRSATKSFIGALYGIAHARQQIVAPNEPIAAWFKDILPRRHANDTLWQELTPYHLLTMTTGLHWITGPKLGERYIHAFHKSPSWIRFALRLPIKTEQRGQFKYRSIDSHLLSVLLTRCTGLTADRYAEQHLFKPLHIQHYEWLRSPDGDAAGHIGLMLTGRDMLKFGELMTYRGTWPPISMAPSSPESSEAVDSRQTMSPTQILPDRWANESMAAQSSGYPGFGTYGYQRWNDQLLGHPCSYALGHGGQLIWSIPELKLSLAMASDPKVRRWRHPKTYLEQELLPAILSP